MNTSLALWHDHSTILLTGYILFAVWVIYDSAVFLTSQEYAQKCGKKVSDLQETIEEPVVYMIAPSTSSPSDQLDLIGDHLECLSELSQTIASSNGIEIRDELWFFSGDNPAQEFERGAQIEKSVPVGGAFLPNACSLAPPKKAQLRAPLSPYTQPGPVVGVPGWQTGAKALCLNSQSPQACKPVRRAPTWLTTALVEWNALLTIPFLGGVREQAFGNLLCSEVFHV